MEDKNTYLKLLSLLLQFPDARYISDLPELEAIVAHLPRGRQRDGLDAFLSDLRGRTPLFLQERYTAAFDLNPATTLNMSYHAWRDSEKRAAVLTRLQQAYNDAGYEKTSAELPDYLPLVLEFLAIFPDARHADAIRDCFTDFDDFVDRLREAAPPYAELLQPLMGIFEDRTAAGSRLPAEGRPL